jgi:hypothetical protein
VSWDNDSIYTLMKIVHLIIHPWSLAARSAAMSHMACVERQIALQNINVVTRGVELWLNEGSQCCFGTESNIPG